MSNGTIVCDRLESLSLRICILLDVHRRVLEINLLRTSVPCQLVCDD